MNFMVYDLSLLAIFVIFISVFLYIRRKNLKREGLLFLYRTEHGINLINKIGNKYKKTLGVLQYVSITLGYILMVAMLYLFGKIVWIYITQQDIVRAVKVPPIVPLIPYIPQIFSLDFLPPFYFTYWIIIIAIVAITHEFAHGVFSAYSKVKIKKTGFGFFPFFLPIFLAFFVEPDEKEMEQKKKIKQMAILSAGTFANIIVAIIFFFALWGFFSASYAPAGVNFDTYSYSIINISQINSVNNILVANPSYEKVLSMMSDAGYTKIKADGQAFVATKDFLSQQKNTNAYLILYEDSPALKANITGAITEINGIKTESKEKLAQVFYSLHPGDAINITTKTTDNTYNYQVVLAANPENKNLPLLGIAFIVQKPTGISGIISQLSYLIKKQNIYYEPIYPAATFIYDLLWWLVLISLSVALVNMLPVGIFDGGKFFLLTVWGITKSKKVAEKVFKFVTYLFLLLLLVIMIFWAAGIF